MKKVSDENTVSITQSITLAKIEATINSEGSDHLPTFGGTYEGGIQCQQCPDEFAQCIQAIIDSGLVINSYLEIGSAAGGSAFLINKFFHPAKIVLIDNNQHPKAHIRDYILRDVLREEIIGNSHNQSTIESLRRLGGNYNLMMIDGDHFYEGVKADVENYRQFLSDGGLLIFHDSVVGAPYGCYQVAQELKQDKRWEIVGEFISETSTKCGILLLRKVGNVDEN